MTAGEATARPAPDADGEQHVDTEVQVLIVGSGLAGIAMARQLRLDGVEDFVVLERASWLGGTWRDNTYPGCACDVPSHLYSYSFRPNPNWSRVHAGQREILAYIEQVASESGVIDHIRFGADLLSAQWADATQRWIVETTSGTFASQVLVTASGHLSDPKLPAIDGMLEFEGAAFHSARWDHDAPLEGARVGVVGTGASAVQIVPEVAKEASSLTVYQRSAPWIRPRNDRTFSDAEQRMFERVPETLDRMRSDIYWGAEQLILEKRMVDKFIQTAEQTALTHLQAQVRDPELLRKLTPDYRFGCKRTLRSNDYYPTFNLSHVDLETNPVTQIRGRSVVTADGNSKDLDVLIFATGFEAADLPIAHRITGRRHELLADHWSEGEQALAGLTVHGFPNLFILNGPNASVVASIIFMIECQVSYVSGALRHMRDGDLAWLEATQEAEDRFAADIDRRSAGTVWLEGGCDNWYVDERSGRLTALWPDFARRYLLEVSEFRAADYAVGRERVDVPAQV